MAYDEFFTDQDKPYAENLNDSLLLLDAFDVTVPLEMPGMFSNGDFSNSVNTPRKCGVGIVTLKSVDSGVTVGTDSISGTGDVVFRIYPNFNSFYKWQSIVLEKTGDVEISFKKIDGTGISATINSEGVISEASALKELQEIDVCFSLDEAEITNILICFVNNQTVHTRVNALLEADQLVNISGTVSDGDTQAVTGGTVYDAVIEKADVIHSHTKSDITDFTHNHTKSDITDFAHNHTKSDITDFTHNHTKSDISDFAHNHDDRYYTESEIDDALSQKSDISHTHSTWTPISLTHGTLYVNTALRMCELHYSWSKAFTDNTWTFIETVSEISNYPPKTTLYAQGSSESVIARLFDTGSIQALCRNANTTQSVTFNLMWHY